MPYGLRNSLFVEHRREHAAQLRFVEDRREPPPALPGFAGSWMNAVSSGRASRNRRTRGTSSGYFFSSSPSKTVTAQSGSSPTIERTFRRWPPPSGSRSTS